MIIFFFDIGLLILLFLIFVIGGAKLILDNIFIIIILSIIFIILFILLCKWPKITFFILCAFIIISLVSISTVIKSQENNIAVHIYKTNDACVVYDTDDNVVNIPSGAIIAKYKDERELQGEGYGVHGYVHACYWYYDGEIHNFFVSNRHEACLDGCAPNVWNIREVGEITYKEFKKGNWMYDFAAQ